MRRVQCEWCGKVGDADKPGFSWPRVKHYSDDAVLHFSSYLCLYKWAWNGHVELEAFEVDREDA
jgi:hypothetical protein